jgi:hypothetical protein
MQKPASLQTKRSNHSVWRILEYRYLCAELKHLWASMHNMHNLIISGSFLSSWFAFCVILLCSPCKYLTWHAGDPL